MRRKCGCSFILWEVLALEICYDQIQLTFAEYLFIIYLESPVYLLMWKCHGRVRVSCLSFEILNASGQSLCPGRIYLSRTKLNAAN